MKRLALILGMFTLLLVSSSNAQQRWERNYGGTGSEVGYSVQQTSDGGYIVVGTNLPLGNNFDRVYLLKTNASGDTLWSRTFGGGSAYEFGNSVQQTQDGGYIVACTHNTFPSCWAYLIKTNASGDSLWSRSYGGLGGGGKSVQQTLDGGYIVAGYIISGSEVYLVKTNASGDALWTRNYGGLSRDVGNSVQQTRDTGYVVTGWTGSFGNSTQVYLIKTNASGDTLWTRTYGGTKEDEGQSVRQTSDGGYIIAGTTYSFRDTINGDVYLIKTDSSGDTLWTRTYGGADYDEGNSVQQTQDGGYIIAGYTCSYRDTINGDAWLIKTNANGDTLWTRTFGGTARDVGYSVQQTSDTGYIVAGYTASYGNSIQVYLIKTNANGSSGIETERGQGFEGSRVQGFKITPNPFTSFATLPGHEAERFSLYDVSGRKVGTYRGDRVGERLSPGVYFLRQEEGSGAPVRVVKIR